MRSSNIILRALEPADVDLLYHWENDPAIWNYSNTMAPFSRFVLEQYVMESHQDIYSAKQLRLMVDLLEENEPVKTIGAIDLFEFDPKHKRAGIGILVAPDERGKGYSSESLELMIDYAFNTLDLHQLFCNIAADNELSLHLFKKHGFTISGTKKEWLWSRDSWIDEYFLQLFRQHPNPSKK